MMPMDFVEQINGKDLSNWQGAEDSYEVVDGNIRCKKGKGGDLLTMEEFENGKISGGIQAPESGQQRHRTAHAARWPLSVGWT